MKLLTKDLCSIEDFVFEVGPLQYHFVSMNLSCMGDSVVLLELYLPFQYNPQHLRYCFNKDLGTQHKVFFKDIELPIKRNTVARIIDSFDDIKTGDDGQTIVTCLLEPEQFKAIFGSTLLTK